ncbi:MAG: hypothetical protein AAGF55_12730 [Pseudomonadota bacterium]
MNKLLFLLIVVAFAGAVGNGTLRDPALGSPVGHYLTPGTVSVCALEDRC